MPLISPLSLTSRHRLPNARSTRKARPRRRPLLRRGTPAAVHPHPALTKYGSGKKS
ncbi:hypothetical protein ACP4OV_022427 [Aristida adscensionis]